MSGRRAGAILATLATLGLVQAAIASNAVAQPRPPRSPVAGDQTEPTAAPRREGADRWIPSLAFEGGVSFQKFDADVSSQICRGCTIPGPGTEPLQPGGPGDDRDATAFVGIQLELMSPELRLPGSPRFFVSGEIAPTFGNERDVVSQGNPGPIGSPANSPSTPFAALVATGQGSQVTMKRDELSFGASAGLAFPLEFLGREFEIRPSINWIRFDVELDGFVSDAECAIVPVAGTNILTTQCNSPPLAANPGFLRQTVFRSSTDETFDGIGPGLQIEMKAGRVGPLGTTVFAGARFYRILGEKDVEIQTGPNTVTDQLGTDQTAARFGFEVDEWLYRFGVGIRLQWLGDDRPSRR